ncbi:hypothetical protein GCM10027190_34870 [Spirosoma areae]
MPTRGVLTVTRNLANEQKPNLWDMPPVARNPEMEALLVWFTQRPKGLMVNELLA